MTAENCQEVRDLMEEMMGAMGGQGMSAMNAGMMDGALGWLGLATLGVILIVGLAFAVAVMRRPAADDSRQILRRRFAKGELSAEEFAEADRILA